MSVDAFWNFDEKKNVTFGAGELIHGWWKGMV
jgi:hypothetical protein